MQNNIAPPFNGGSRPPESYLQYIRVSKLSKREQSRLNDMRLSDAIILAKLAASHTRTRPERIAAETRIQLNRLMAPRLSPPGLRQSPEVVRQQAKRLAAEKVKQEEVAQTRDLLKRTQKKFDSALLRAEERHRSQFNLAAEQGRSR